MPINKVYFYEYMQYKNRYIAIYKWNMTQKASYEVRIYTWQETLKQLWLTFCKCFCIYVIYEHEFTK